MSAVISQGNWKCVGAESGIKFDDVELSANEPEWTDYDEKVRSSNCTTPTPARTKSSYTRCLLRFACTAWLIADRQLTPQANAGVSIMELESKIVRA